MRATATISTAAPVDDVITRTFKALAGASGRTVEQIGTAVGITKRTIYRRVAAGGWTAVELSDLADYFGVEPGDFFTGRIDVSAVALRFSAAAPDGNRGLHLVTHGDTRARAA